MRASNTHPLLSAWEALCGKFDIMATPIAPLGMKVLVHDTPENRGTWQVHGSPGFYIGRAFYHYRCHNVWMKETRALRVSNCLAWFPTLVKMPGSSHIYCRSHRCEKLTTDNSQRPSYFSTWH